MRTPSTSALEHHNVHAALTPYIHNASVLDLACGTGDYFALRLEWGDKSVLGLILSPTMIAVAKAAHKNLVEGGRLRFRVGDIGVVERYESAHFDLVLGSPLLNYAAHAQSMINMFQNIALKL